MSKLASNGAIIIAGRQKFLRELEVKAQDTHHALTGGLEHPHIEIPTEYHANSRGY